MQCRRNNRKEQFRGAIPDFQKANALGASYPWTMPYSIARCYDLSDDQEKAVVQKQLGEEAFAAA